MFRSISVPAQIRKIIILPYTTAVSNELYNIFIPNDVILVLWYPTITSSKIPPPFIHSLSSPLSAPYSKIQPLYHNVYLFHFESNNLDACALLLGFLHNFNIPIYCELPFEYDHMFYDFQDIFNVNHISSSLYDCIYNDVILNSFYPIFKDYLQVPKSIKDMSDYDTISVSHFLSRLFQSNSLIIDNKYNFTLRPNNYANFIQSASNNTSTILSASEYPNSLKSLDKFNSLNFNISLFPLVVSQSPNPKVPNNEIKFGKHIFKSSIATLDLEQTAVIANAYIFYLMNHCWQKFKYFQGISYYYNGKLNMDHDQLLFNKCRKLIATHDTYFDPCKYIAFASNFIKKYSDEDMLFTFYASVERINYFTATLSVANLNYSDVSCDFSSKDECKQQLSKVFCIKYGVIKSLFISNQTMIFKEDMGKISPNELEGWIEQLPAATLFIEQKSNKRKLKSSELLLILKKQKLEGTPKSVESVWNIKASENGWNTVASDVVTKERENAWAVTANTQKPFNKGKENATEWQPITEKRFEMNKSATATWNQNIVKPDTPALKFGLGFQKKKKEIKLESFTMTGLSNIEVKLMFKKQMIQYPRSYTCDYEYLKRFANVSWGKVTEAEKKEFWKYSMAMKLHKSSK